MTFRSIRSRITFLSCLCLLIMGTTIIVYAAFYVRSSAIRRANDEILFIAQDRAEHVRDKLDRAMACLHTLAIILGKVKDPMEPMNFEREHVDSMLQAVLKQNKDAVGIYTCWQPNAFDNKDKYYENEPGHGKTGCFSPYWYRNRYGLIDVEPLIHEEGEDSNSFGISHKNIEQAFITDPHIHIVDGKEVLVISLVVPMLLKDDFYGIVGIDLGVGALQGLTEEAGIVEKGAQVIILSAGGKIVGTTGRPDLAGEDASKIVEDIGQYGKEISIGKGFIRSFQNNLEFFSPIEITNSKPWWIIVSIPRTTITAEATGLSRHLIFVGLSLILASMVIFWLFSNSIVKPLKSLMKGAKEIGRGDYGRVVEDVSSEDEIGELASAFNTMSLKIKERELERDKAEESLEESEARYRSMMEAMKDPIYICSPDFRIEYMNPAMIRRTGRDATGEFCFKALHDLDEKCPWCMHDKSQQGEYYESEIVSPKDNRSYHISCSPIVHGDGSISKMTVFRDTTDLKTLETQLQQAQKMEAIGTLSGGIAHDFNNILGGIIGYAELAKMKAPEGSEVIADLERVLKSSNRATTLVKQILTVSRQHKQEQRPVQVRYIVNEALDLLRATLPTTIEIREDLAKDTGIVNADPTQMHQVIMNLGTNAGHAMQEDGGVLEVSLANVELDDLSASKHLDLTAGSYLRLTVRDTGHGMTSEIMERIFDPYFTTKDTGQGTGLGLSVAQGIVKALGGTITVYSELGKGTTFHVYLPVILEEEREEKEPEEPLPTGNERILFIDDEQALVEIASQMLEQLRYEVVTKRSGVQALELFRAEPDRFDLIITDMTMPDMTGDKLAKELMKIRPDIRVILCTGHSRMVVEEKAKEIGIKAFVMKPLVMRNLAETVRKVLDADRSEV